MAGFRSLVLGLAVLGIFGSAADAAPRRGGWYWWWARQAAAARTSSEPGAVPADVPPAPELAPEVIPVTVTVGPTAPSVITTNSLFGTVAPAGLFINPAAAPLVEPTANYYASPVHTSYDYDAFVNFTGGSFAQAASLTTGSPMAWFESPVVRDLYGGTPSDQQQAEFTSVVMQRIDQTFRDSGVAASLTSDPGASAAHTLSVASNTSFAQNPDAIGITDMGNDGFSFIDKLAYANSVDQLQWAVAHNVAHELMHAFNVEHHDKTGQFLDAAVASWDMLIDPGTVFSAEAVQDLASQDFRSRFSLPGQYGAQGLHLHATELLAPNPVPEPTTWLAWGLLASTASAYHRRRCRLRRVS
jgi:hypothetical protein